MMRTKRYLAMIITVVITLTVTGCWDYSEINEKYVVSGVAIDYDNFRKKYILTIEVVKPEIKGREATLSSKVVTSEGKTIFEGIRNSIAQFGKRVYWSHAKIIIVSEGIAEKGMYQVLDFMMRDAELRWDIWVLVAKGSSAKDMLKSKSGIQDITAFQINDAMKNDKAINKYPTIELWQFADWIYDDTVDPLLPTIYMEGVEKTVPQVLGTAVFKEDRLVGYLNAEETINVQIIRNKIKNSVLPIEKDALSLGADLTLEFFKCKTKLKPAFENDNTKIVVDIELVANIAEISKDIDLSDEKILQQIKNDSEAYIEKMVENTIKKVQKELKSDIFGFGRAIKNKDLKLWRVLEPNWPQVFSEMPSEAVVRLTIGGTALRSGQLKRSNE
jgi:spore germination protein KC